jgi:hypothetical protein
MCTSWFYNAIAIAAGNFLRWYSAANSNVFSFGHICLLSRCVAVLDGFVYCMRCTLLDGLSSCLSNNKFNREGYANHSLGPRTDIIISVTTRSLQKEATSRTDAVAATNRCFLPTKNKTMKATKVFLSKTKSENLVIFCLIKRHESWQRLLQQLGY